jgi:nucleoid-associated protein YgaU
VWDTVGSLGVPDSVLFAPLLNRKYKFYDIDISTLVASARHAVAIDEQKRSFAPTLWTTLDALNRSCGYQPEDDRAPYQQKWFPGVHGSVGGGGDFRGLSDFALQWVIDGARHAGLQLDVGGDSRIFGLAPNPRAPLDNVKAGNGGLIRALAAALPKAPRSPGPSRVQDVSASAQARWDCAADELPERALYRPRTLATVADALEALRKGQAPPAEPPVAPTTAAPMPGDYYRIVRGDTLTAIAQKAYGAASMFELILDSNPALLGDADHIYANQLIFIPPAPSPIPVEATTDAGPAGP